jgi:hypothetical protein
MGVGSNLVQLAFVTYLFVVAFNLYHLFVPTRWGAVQLLHPVDP